MNDFKVIFDEFEYVYNPETDTFVCTFDGETINFDTMLRLIVHEVKVRKRKEEMNK